jgi:hypothetical protein
MEHNKLNMICTRVHNVSDVYSEARNACALLGMLMVNDWFI